MNIGPVYSESDATSLHYKGYLVYIDTFVVSCGDWTIFVLFQMYAYGLPTCQRSTKRSLDVTKTACMEHPVRITFTTQL